MYFATYLFATYGLLEVTAAFKLPFHLPWANARLNDEQAPLALPAEEEPYTNRIAVIGAGAGGSSAAFFIGKAKERYGLDVEVDIFDSNSYVGGRSITVQPYDNPEYEPVELGASIFVGANKNLWRATDEFGLERSDFEDGDDTLGIWDGQQFVLTTGQSKVGGWWDTVKVVWRYGFQAPTRTKNIVKNMIDEFVTLYNSTWGSQPFSNLTDLAAELGWSDIVSQSTMDYFDSQNINARWTREMVEAATRVNYGQNSDEIHALEGLCSLAATGASSVKGGNWQIFDQFVKRSGANLYLNSTVVSINQLNEDKFTLKVHNAGTPSIQERNYRAVILAAPLHGSSIQLSLTNNTPAVPPQPYVHLHVTLLSTPNPQGRTRFFGLKEKDKVPSMVLTTYEGARQRGEDSAPPFNSMSYHGQIKYRDGTPANSSRDGAPEWVVKIFSKERVEDSFLRRAYGKIGWVHRKEWDAYPLLPPTTSFPPVKLAKGFYYVNSFEPFISTMETETISGRNIAELLLQEEFKASICKPSNATDTDEPDEPKDEPKEFVYGWDC